MSCDSCKKTPGYHSFEFIGTVAETQTFYCFPANNTASVRTREDMLEFVNHFPTEGPWNLLFHARGYTMSHMMPLFLAIEMAKIVQRDHAKNLRKIFVVEGGWFFRFLILCIFPFLSESMREKFVLVNGSLLESLMRLQEEGFSLAQLQPLRDNTAKIEPEPFGL
jgi:hypothetical protein